MPGIVVTLELSGAEMLALEQEYKRRGLDSPPIGYVHTPLDAVHKRIVEEFPKLRPAAAPEHVRHYGPQP